MEKIWLKHYPKSVPPEIEPHEFASVVEILERSCENFASRPAFSNMGRTLSFAELDALSRDFAAYLHNAFAFAKGDRVAIMMPNLLQYPVALFGILRAGLVVVNVNPLYKPRELEHQLIDSGARAIVLLANFANVLAQVIDRTAVENVIVTEVGDLLSFPKSLLMNFVVKHVKKMVPPYRVPGAIKFSAALAAGKGQSLKSFDLDHEDLAFLQYTGGTTGVAKGAMLSHGNIVANVQQVSAVLRPRIVEGGEIVITPLPLYHIFCLTCNCLCFMRFGALNVLITNPRDLKAFVNELSRWKFTAITAVNTLLNGLLNNQEFRQLDFSALKLSVGGGMAVQQAVADEWLKLTGDYVLEGYGLTETSPVVCVNPVDLQQFTGSIGLPVPSTDVSVRDENGNEVVLGEAGELWVKGPQVMPGYWQRPEETAGILTEDGWLGTGDIATIDDKGFVRIIDRKKDMILVSGFNVYPNEIEDTVAMHDGVLEVACIGVPDDKTGEAVKVFVVAKENVELTVADIREHCKAQLTGYKIPKFVEFREALPKSNVGKILRRKLR